MKGLEGAYKQLQIKIPNSGLQTVKWYWVLVEEFSGPAWLIKALE